MSSRITGTVAPLDITYCVNFVYGWLQPFERIQLNLTATLARFEAKLAYTLQFSESDGTGQGYVAVPLTFSPVEGVDFDFAFARGGQPVDTQAAMGWLRMIHDLSINSHWLVYETPADHAAALWNTRAINLRLTLVTDLMDAYGLPFDQARMLLDNAQMS